jgi:hypothetical protein
LENWHINVSLIEQKYYSEPIPSATPTNQLFAYYTERLQTRHQLDAPPIQQKKKNPDFLPSCESTIDYRVAVVSDVFNSLKSKK